MAYKTYSEIKAKLLRDEDLQDVDFVSDTEILGYFNEAMAACESKIHGIYEDYFLKRDYLAMVTGAEEISLPTDIFANKIRAILYKNGADIYALRRMRFTTKFIDHAYIDHSGTSEDYQYMILNQSASAGRTILLVPVSRETASTGDKRLEIWYLRQANRFTGTGTEYCDIPEFHEYIIQYVKVQCIAKEVGNPKLQFAMNKLAELDNEMINTLKLMVPDADDTLEQDFTHYQEHT